MSNVGAAAVSCYAIVSDRFDTTDMKLLNFSHIIIMPVSYATNR